jgi:hypothetical protein
MEYQANNPDGEKTLDDFRERDYAGLTALTGEEDVAAAEAAARQMVNKMTQSVGHKPTPVESYVSMVTKQNAKGATMA